MHLGILPCDFNYPGCKFSELPIKVQRAISKTKEVEIVVIEKDESKEALENFEKWKQGIVNPKRLNIKKTIDEKNMQ